MNSKLSPEEELKAYRKFALICKKCGRIFLPWRACGFEGPETNWKQGYFCPGCHELLLVEDYEKLKNKNMNIKTFGLIRPGDEVYLVCKDKDTKLFKIRTVKVTEATYSPKGTTVNVKCGILEFEASPNNTYAYHRHVDTFIKGFTNTEEAQEDYKSRLVGEIKELASKSARINERIHRAGVLLSNARNYGAYKGLKFKK